MTGIEYTNARISQRYAATFAVKARDGLSLLLKLHGKLEPRHQRRIEGDVRDAQRNAAIHTRYILSILAKE